MVTDDRTRIHEIPSKVVKLWFQSPAPQFHTLKPANHIAYAVRPRERVWYERYTPNSSKDHKVWKSFSHYLCVTKPKRLNEEVILALACGFTNSENCITKVTDPYLVYNPYSLGEIGSPTYVGASLYDYKTDDDFIAMPTNLIELQDYAIRCMTPKLKAELSLVNSLIELKDLLSLKSTAKSLFNSVYKILGRLGGKSSKPVGKVASQMSADAYLQWKFNIKPLISDITGIYRAISSYEKCINKFVAGSGKLTTAHFKCDIDSRRIPNVDAVQQPVCPFWPTITSGAGEPFVTGLYSSSEFTRKSVTELAEFRSELQYVYTLSDYQREHAKLLGFLDMLGINFNPAIIWNALPWSFVVDWVFGVSQWLDQFKVSNLAPKINIIQYCWSVKYRRRIECEGVVKTLRNYPGDGIMYYPFQRIKLQPTYEIAYRRSVGMPRASSFEMSGLSPTELSLGAALVVSRRKPKRRNP